MKMLTIICRENLEGSVVQVLNDLGAKGYTVMSGLGGRGETGTQSIAGQIEMCRSWPRSMINR